MRLQRFVAFSTSLCKTWRVECVHSGAGHQSKYPMALIRHVFHCSDGHRSVSPYRCAELYSVRLFEFQGRVGKAVFALHQPASSTCVEISCPECQHSHLCAFISGLYSDPKLFPEATIIIYCVVRVSKLPLKLKQKIVASISNLPQVLNESGHLTRPTSILLWKEIFPDHH